ncbi:hypothetical protein [Streptomyces clavifer]|uniref:hypothetical protein n=1 Tax=Streptomyces clavifer TaxID=68188 RepID=UPI0033E1336B
MRMPRELQSFFHDLGVDLCLCSVDGCEDSYSSSSPASRSVRTSACPKPWWFRKAGSRGVSSQAGQHPCGGFPSLGTAHRVQGEAEFVERFGKEAGHVVLRLRA